MNKSWLPEIAQPASKPPIQPKDLAEGKIIYEGDYCNVLSLEKYGHTYALKTIRKKDIEDNLDQEIKRIQNEIRILYQCKHPNIIELLGHFETDDHIVLIFPLFGQTLDVFIKAHKKKKNKRPFTLALFLDIFRQIARGMFQFQAKGFIHRDISSDNILINEDYQIKIIDFGYSNPIQRNRKTKIGTLMYLAPEVIAQKSYNHKVDIWAFGILSYQLLYGIYLFRPKGKGLTDAEIEEEYLKNMMQPIEDLPDDKLLVDQRPSEQILEHIKCMLSFNPEKRPEVGYLLSRRIFGASSRQFETYDIEQYIRKRTQRKTNKMSGKIGGNVKQMSVGQLQEVLFSLISQHSNQLNRQKQLLSYLINVEDRLANERINKNEISSLNLDAFDQFQN